MSIRCSLFGHEPYPGAKEETLQLGPTFIKRGVRTRTCRRCKKERIVEIDENGNETGEIIQEWMEPFNAFGCALDAFHKSHPKEALDLGEVLDHFKGP